MIKHFSIECRQSEGRKMLLRANENSSKNNQARENAGDQVVIGFSFAFYSLREWCEFSGPITEQSKAKAMQFRITTVTQLEIALFLR